jgi:hypothetical protein
MVRLTTIIDRPQSRRQPPLIAVLAARRFVDKPWTAAHRFHLAAGLLDHGDLHVSILESEVEK